ncbi:hypothetical protein CLLU_29030 [Clostridium luticellarii]|jgi:hypothetical protein|uniref:Uncharacterized protein n=1 Tax=Clostridium luticellarii TaxID=1691940 RepID=A0A2T0BEM7_9CLOT|nr:hypothetical protein CLLU_29030 [Clostridium luticellarii]
MNEKEIQVKSGIKFIWIDLLLLILSIFLFILGAAGLTNSGIFDGVAIILGIVLFLLGCFLVPGFFTLQPNVAAVLTLFGEYRGTVKQAGWIGLTLSIGRKKFLSV